MRVRVLPVLLVLLLAGVFAMFNWPAFSTPTTLSLIVTDVVAPLGLVMLGFLAVLAVMYIASVVYLQGSSLMESRRLGRDLQAQRELADKAEASRFTELREFMNAEMARVSQANDQLRASLFSRLDEMERRQRTIMEQNANSLSAYIGEMEDRLENRRMHRVDVDLPPADQRAGR